MNDVFDVAAWVHSELSDLGLQHAFIGGIALQAWGESRVTRDVDVSVLTGFDDEEQKVGTILSRIPARSESALEQALKYRVLLCQSPNGIGIDIGLAAFPFEEDVLARSTVIELTDGVVLPLASAEDMITMKVFAGRPRDWEDVRGIIVRQGKRIDWTIVESTLPELLELIEFPERLEVLAKLRVENAG